MAAKLRKAGFYAAVCMGLLASLPAQAQEEGGLPQLDVTKYPGQLFWLAISFAILYIVMSRIALPRVAQTQDKRKQVIAAELESARDASDKAKETVVQVDKSLKEARARAHATVMDMIAKVAEDSQEKHAAQERETLRNLHRSEATIAVAREAALQSIRGDAADLAAAAIEKIIGSKIKVGP